MLSVGDLVQVIVNQRFIPSNEQMLNVFHYRITEVTPEFETTADYIQFAAEVLIGMHGVVSVFQTPEIAYDSAVFTNLTNGLDFGTYIPPVDLFGVVTSATEPLHVALSFKLNRSTLATRNGSKRFSGIADTLITDATGQGIAGLTQTATLEEWLADSFSVVVGDGINCTAQPIILRKTATGIPPTVYNPIANAQFRGVGSQNSRKQLL